MCSDYMACRLELDRNSFDYLVDSVFTHLTDSSIRAARRIGHAQAGANSGSRPTWAVTPSYGRAVRGGADRMTYCATTIRPGRCPVVLISDCGSASIGAAFRRAGIEPNIHNQSWACWPSARSRCPDGGPEPAGRRPPRNVAIRHNLRQAQREVEAPRSRAAEVSRPSAGSGADASRGDRQVSARVRGIAGAGSSRALCGREAKLARDYREAPTGEVTACEAATQNRGDRRTPVAGLIKRSACLSARRR